MDSLGIEKHKDVQKYLLVINNLTHLVGPWGNPKPLPQSAHMAMSAASISSIVIILSLFLSRFLKKELWNNVVMSELLSVLNMPI